MTSMTGTARGARRPVRFSQSVGALVGMGITVLAITLFALLVGHHGNTASGTSQHVVSQRQSLSAWEAKVHPLIERAAQVVALGPRQGAKQIEGSEFSVATNQKMASGWVASLTAVRGQLSGVAAPAFLADAQRLLDQSIDGYITASQDLLSATTASAPRRASLLTASAVAGRNADHLYDEATAAIAKWRATLGLAADWSAS